MKHIRAPYLLVFGTFLAVTARGEEAFVDVTARSGIQFQLVNGATGLKHLYETMIGGVAWLDFDGDGFLDLYLIQGHEDSAHAYLPGKASNVLYRNRGDGTFEDVTAKSGLGDRRYGAGVATGDIDNDGDVDVYVTNYGPNVLYLNNGDGTFSDITGSAGVECSVWSAAAAFLDVNRDGFLDLYVANYLYYDPRVHRACTGNPKKLPGYCHPNKFDGAPDSLFISHAGRHFSDVSKQAGVTRAGRILAKGLGVIPTDFNLDGWVDILVANDSVPNFLWRNLGSRLPKPTSGAPLQTQAPLARFDDFALAAGVSLNSFGHAEACMGVDGGDVNGDGLTDYFVTNFAEETDTLYLGEEGGFFTDSSVRTGIAEATYTPLGFGTKLFDYDLDGDLDLYIARGHILDNVEILNPNSPLKYAQPDQLLENDGKGNFREVSSTSGAWFSVSAVGRGAAFGDYDNDGDIDVFVVNVDKPSVLLQNRATRQGHWLGIHLQGNGPCNRDALGARVEVQITGRQKLMPIEIRTSASYLAANDPRQVIGLKPKENVEWIRVHWPDGLVETFTGLKHEQYNTVVRGQGAAKPSGK